MPVLLSCALLIYDNVLFVLQWALDIRSEVHCPQPLRLRLPKVRLSLCAFSFRLVREKFAGHFNALALSKGFRVDAPGSVRKHCRSAVAERPSS